MNKVKVEITNNQKKVKIPTGIRLLIAVVVMLCSNLRALQTTQK